MEDSANDLSEVVEEIKSGVKAKENDFLAEVMTCMTDAIHDVENDIKNASIGGAAQKLIDKVVELLKVIIHVQDKRRVLVDFMTEEGAVALFKAYFDILSIKIEGNTELESPYLGILYHLLYICSCFTDESVTFSEDLVAMGTLTNMANILKIYENTFKDNTETQGYLILNATLVLYNCSISSNNKIYYRDIGAVELIGRFAKNTKGVAIMGDSSLSTCCMLTLAHITDEDDNDVIVTDDAIIDNIMENLDIALEAHQEFGMRVVFSAKELALGLTKLANNNKNSLTIVERGALPRLMSIIEKGKTDEQITAVNCIWTLSFVKENKEVIGKDPNIPKKLQEFLENAEGELRQAAAGALWELRDLRSETTEESVGCLPHNPSLEGETPHIMLSYNWENQQVMKKLKLYLESNGYKVWMDIHQMKGDTLDAMADAVEQSAVVLICMSQKYKDSQNCRSEAEYAYKMKKGIVPLKLQKGYSPNGWLGLIIGTKLYYDFAETTMFEDSVSQLVQEIGNRGKKHDGIQELDGPTIQPVQSEQLEQLPRESNLQPSHPEPCKRFEVEQWAERHKLQVSRYVNIDLETLQFLRSLKSEAPEYFYRHINQQLGIVTSKDLMLFTKALQNLR